MNRVSSISLIKIETIQSSHYYYLHVLDVVLSVKKDKFRKIDENCLRRFARREPRDTVREKHNIIGENLCLNILPHEVETVEQNSRPF